MSKVPKIVIEKDLHSEVDIFYWALHNDSSPWQRKSIFGFFKSSPLLQQLSDNKSRKEEKEIIEQFLQDLHQTFDVQVNSFLETSNLELEQKSDQALVELANLMDYKWPKDQPNIKVVPVFLPFSPFGPNIFFFSVVSLINNSKQHSLLSIAVHEISHMIFLKIVDQKLLEKGYIPAIDFLKEILAPVFMNQPSLKKLIDLRSWPKGYFGNTDLEQVYVLVGKSKKKEQIGRYFQRLYEEMRYEDHKTFKEILEVMVPLAFTLEKELLQKRKMWNEYGYRIFTNKKLLKEYSKLIKVGIL